MSIYDKAPTGVQVYRTRFNLSFRKMFTCKFSRLIPIMAKFVMPSDIWKCSADILVRFQPMLAPTLTKCNVRVRYGFIPLRLLNEHTEEIITGSKNGKLITTTLPEFPAMFDDATDCEVKQNSILDYLGIPVMDYSSIKNDESMPARYWEEAYLRFWFDYYRDENLDEISDFEDLVNVYKKAPGTFEPLSVNLRKDYFTSSLPWQLKGVAPTFDITINNPFMNQVDVKADLYSRGTDFKVGEFYPTLSGRTESSGTIEYDLEYSKSSSEDSRQASTSRLYLNPDELNDSFAPIGSSFTMQDLRTMSAQTRVFERLARCGSRYVEYLRANFNIAPADETLQRSQYLGGFKIPIVTTEVVQTAEDSDYPVGTLRGHGISHGGNSIRPFVAKEFGIIMALLDIMPEVQYTQGIDRELTYKRRWDFFNPSFQNLSEQEVRNGEVFVSATDGKNDDTFGFVPMYQELRKSRDIVVSEMRNNLSYWTQALHFNSRPNLNQQFIRGTSYDNDFGRPFAVSPEQANPIIVDCFNGLDVYRPMVKHAVPGLIDHN